MSQVAIEAVISEDGSLQVDARDLARRGAGPGDRVLVTPLVKRTVRSMMGVGARGSSFTDDHLRQLRAEMGDGVGEDLTP